MSHLHSTPTQNLCSAFLTEWSHFRNKNTAIAPRPPEPPISLEPYQLSACRGQRKRAVCTPCSLPF